MLQVKKKLLQDEKGAITIWLTLLLVCMLCAIIVVIECISIYQSKSICIQTTKIATISAMADYEPDIYDNYHIFVLDECYGKAVRNRDRLEGKILRYANSSIKPNSQEDKSIDIMGCSVNKIEVSKVKYLGDNNSNFINQICAYMESHLDESLIMELCDKYGTTKEKVLLCEYIFSHFCSYKSNYILGYMKREFVYEIEYILMGDKTDNDNISKVKKILKIEGIDVEEDIVCSEDRYREVLYKNLIEHDKDILCNRIKHLIVNNINATFDKRANLKDLITNVEVGIEYNIEERATKIQLVRQWLGRRFSCGSVTYKEKFSY